MEAGKHTPGTWEAKGRYVFAGKNCIAICDTANSPTARMEANAQMMAAASDMFAALRSAEIAVEQLCVGQHPENQCWEVLREIRAAIAKASPQ